MSLSHLQYRNNDPLRQVRCGVTLIEILVVVSVIALLMAIALPALRSVRAVGRMTAEQNAARQLMAAYIAYANVNQDRVLTGVAPTTFSAFDAKGDPVTMAQARQRYPWRLAPYLDYRVDGLLLHEQREIMEEAKYSQSHDMYVYAVSLVPSLGLNARWVGGDFSKGASPRACLQSEILQQSGGFNDCAVFDKMFGRFWITRIAEPRTPERLIVFASARGQEPIEQWGTKVVEGYFKVESPYFTKAAPDWNATFALNDLPAKFGYVSPRHNGLAVIGFMDGHAGTLSRNDLTDMRHWADQADSPEWFMKAKTP